MTNQQNKFLKSLGITPGPWQVNKPIDCDKYSVDGPPSDFYYLDKEEDARIQAVSPSLLCALVEVIEGNEEQDFPYTSSTNQAKIKIQKATGKPWLEVKKLWEESFKTVIHESVFQVPDEDKEEIEKYLKFKEERKKGEQDKKGL